MFFPRSTQHAIFVWTCQLALLAMPIAANAQESVWQSLNNSGLEALNRGDADRALPLLQKAVKAAEATFASTDVRTCQSYTFLGECLYMQGKYKEAEPYFKKSYNVLRRQTGKEYQFMSVYNCRLLAYVRVQLNRDEAAEPLLAWVTQMEDRRQVMQTALEDDLATYAGVLERREKIELAQAKLQQCLKIATKSKGEHDPKTMSVRFQLVNLKRRAQNFDQAEAESIEFAKQVDSLRARDPSGAGKLYLQLSGYHLDQQRWTQAREFAQRALDACEAGDAPPQQEMDLALARLGDIEYGLNRLEKGDGYYAKRLALQESASPFNEMALAPTLEKLAWSALRQKNEASAGGLIDRSLGIRRRRQGATHEDVALSLHLKAEWFALRDDHKEAEATHQEALRLRQQARGLGGAAVESSVFELVNYYQGRGLPERAERLLRNTLEQREKAVGAQSSELNAILSRFAGWFAAQGKLDECEKLLKRAVSNAEKSGKDSLALADALAELATFYERVSRYTESEALFARVVKIRELRQGPYHLQTASAWDSLAWAKQRLGKAAEGLPLAQRAASVCRASLDEGDPMLPQSLNVLAVCLDHTGDTDAARLEYKHALSLYERQADLEGVGTVSHNLATVTQDNAEAKALYEKSLEIGQKTLESKSNFVGRLLDLGNMSRGHRNLGDLLRSMGNWAEARSHYLQALQACEDGLGEEHELLIDALKALAWIEHDRGRMVDADACFERALRLSQRRNGPRTAEAADLLRGIGWVRFTQGRFAESESSFLDDLAMRREISDRSVGDSLLGAAAAALCLGKVAECDARLLEAAEAHGDNSRTASFAKLQLLRARRRQSSGALKQACGDAEMALAIFEDLQTPPQARWQGQLLLSELRIAVGDFQQAEAGILAILDAAPTQPDAESVDVAQARYLLARQRQFQRNFADAEEQCGQARQLFDKLLGAESHGVAECDLLLLEIQLAREALPADGLDRCRTATGRLQKSYGSESPFLAAALLTEARVLASQNRPAEQRDVLDRIQTVLQASAATSTLAFVDLQQQLARLEMALQHYDQSEAALRLASETLQAMGIPEHPQAQEIARLSDELAKLRPAEPGR